MGGVCAAVEFPVTESRDRPTKGDGVPIEGDGEGAVRAGVNWRVLWPVPVLVLSTAMFVAGLVTAFYARPKPDPVTPLRDAAALIERDRYEEALDVLNRRVRPFLTAPETPPEVPREFFRLRASAMYHGQRVLGVDRVENHRAIVRDYLEAERLGSRLSVAEMTNLVRSRLALSESEAAAERVRGLPASEHSLRRALIREIVEHELGRRMPRHEIALQLLPEVLTDPAGTMDDRVWAVSRQAEVRLAMGHPEETITQLLRAMQQLRDASDSQRGLLHVLLGRAYYESGQFGHAGRQAELAEELLSPDDYTMADVYLLRGRIELAQNSVEEARDYFFAVVEGYVASPAYGPALLGLAESEALLGRDGDSQERYRELVEQILRERGGYAVTPSEVRRSLMDRFRDRFLAGRTRESVGYARLAEMLDDPDDVPEAVLLALASGHRLMAEEILEEAGLEPGLDPGSSLSEVERQEVKRHFLVAGDYYRRHAQKLVITDSVGYARSLWEAADSYDMAGALGLAIEVFSDYVAGAGDDDPRRAEARFRLAQAFHAEGDIETAMSLYRELIAARSAGESGRGVGIWADKSYVPLAQCYMYIEGDEMYIEGDEALAEAEDLLRSVVDGRLFAPEAREFRDGLIELGYLHYRTGRYAEAIERLAEAAERYPDYPGLNSVRFALADAHRLSALQIERELESAMPHARREQLERVRAERLRGAMAMYEQVRGSIESIEEDRRDELDRVHLRNAYFYLGDCAFDLGEYRLAIEHFDTARQQYPDDPASLVASVQIVNAYVEQGEWEKAATANQRARQHLARLPDTVWESPRMPMERRHWERWLESTTLIDQMARAGG